MAVREVAARDFARAPKAPSGSRRTDLSCGVGPQVYGQTDRRRASFSVEDYTTCTVPVPPRRRAGSRPGELSDEFRAAIATEARRLESAGTPVDVIRGVGDAFAALDDEVAQFAAVRLRAIAELRGQGWTYSKISDETGLSEARVAQLARAARGA
jgi:uncharacterized protein YerC